MAPLHTRTHPDYVEGCFGCKAASTSVGFHGVPNGKAEFHGATVRERVAREVDACRKQGFEPERADGTKYRWV